MELAHDLPIGQGFGTSAAGALATGLAVAELVGAGRRKATEVAHLADLFGEGGLGGVAAILGGGLELRRSPGIPPYGKVARRPLSGEIVVGTVGGPLPSPEILRRPRYRARFARGRRLVDALGVRPGEGAFWDAAEAFTTLAGLSSPQLEGLLRGLRRRGARAAQAMFGAAFFARLPAGARGREALRWIEGCGVRPVTTRIGGRGGHLLPSRSATQAF